MVDELSGWHVTVALLSIAVIITIVIAYFGVTSHISVLEDRVRVLEIQVNTLETLSNIEWE
jgi:hypothetical protein|tara:strand:- start:22 stop:204 length:183 start_codon:yes stop_codon:yes gene_type:complete